MGWWDVRNGWLCVRAGVGASTLGKDDEVAGCIDRGFKVGRPARGDTYPMATRVRPWLMAGEACRWRADGCSTRTTFR